MTDEKYLFIQDCKDKKITARSARSTRTHCGKRGAVKFPSDYMTKKELEAMNGACESYRLNEPVSYEVFKSWPKHIQEDYIKLLRKKFNVPLGYISKMVFGKEQSLLSWYIKRYGLDVGVTSTRRKIAWDEKGFKEWCNKGKESDVQEKFEEELTELGESLATPAINPFKDVYSSASTSDINRMVDEMNKAWNETLGNYRPIQEAIDEQKKETEPTCEIKTVIPCNGEMTFQGNVDDILRTISKLLDGRQVRLEVEWEVLG